ncbi:MAG: CHASE2 domain-containing protein [Candidatus Omnitrophica bacterium]|nr:CHASE2 domain-containing protein [Candidatus Omnitrophota bacterium]MBU4487964.1 CHASE2 domain-containing protein [Candidatus Omnitrophota bacterium]MCG2705165.1 CHASE2 domain-containing protein [Candidatus Omnitrophota bacterium]
MRVRREKIKIDLDDIATFLEAKAPLFLGAASIVILSVYVLTTLSSPRIKEYRLSSSDDLFNERYQYNQTSDKDKLHPKDIVFVTLSEESIRHVGTDFPWGRDIYADFLDKVKEDNPKVIAIDIALYGEGRGGPEVDMKLADAIKKCGNVILASAYGKEMFYLGPNETFAKASRDYGVAGTMGDIDYVARRVRISSLLVHNVKKLKEISFEIKMALQYLGIPYDTYKKTWQNFIFESKDKRVVLPADENGYLVINYLSKSEDVTTIPVWEVLEEKTPKGLFKDKLVLLSRTGNVSRDMLRTPIGDMRGGAVIANIANSIITGNYIREMNSKLAFLLTALLFLLCFLAFRKHFLTGFFVLIFVYATAPLLSSYLFMNADIIWRAFDILRLLPVLLLVEIAYKVLVFFIRYTDSVRNATINPETGFCSETHFFSEVDYAASHAVKFKHACSLIAIRITNLEWIKKDLSFRRSEMVYEKIVELIKTKLKENSFIGFVKLILKRKVFACDFPLDMFEICLPYLDVAQANTIADSLLHNIKEIDFKITKEHLKPTIAIGISSVDAESFPKRGEGLRESAEAASERAEEMQPNEICRFNIEVDGPGIETYIAREKSISFRKIGFSSREYAKKLIEEKINFLHREVISEKEKDRIYKEVFHTFIKRIEKKDLYTGGHVVRCGEYTEKIARKLKMPERDVRLLTQEAVLHDIGKIGVPADILRKEGDLTYEERKIMEVHPVISAEILDLCTYFRRMRSAVEAHHERLDGSGYPRGLKGGDIPREAQILAIVDVYDALTSERSYRKKKKKFSEKEAIEELESQKEGLNQEIVSVLKEILKEEGKLTG